MKCGNLPLSFVLGVVAAAWCWCWKIESKSPQKDKHQLFHILLLSEFISTFHHKLVSGAGKLIACTKNSFSLIVASVYLYRQQENTDISVYEEMVYTCEMQRGTRRVDKYRSILECSAGYNPVYRIHCGDVVSEFRKEQGLAKLLHVLLKTAGAFEEQQQPNWEKTSTRLLGPMFLHNTGWCWWSNSLLYRLQDFVDDSSDLDKKKDHLLTNWKIYREHENEF